jgi:hypothetical protein
MIAISGFKLRQINKAALPAFASAITPPFAAAFFWKQPIPDIPVAAEGFALLDRMEAEDAQGNKVLGAVGLDCGHRSIRDRVRGRLSKQKSAAQSARGIIPDGKTWRTLDCQSSAKPKAAAN